MSTITATREVHGFSEVVLWGYGELDVEQRAEALGRETIEIEADEELVRRIRTEVRGNRLVLGLSMPWYEWLTWWFQWLFLPSKRIRYRLAAGRLEALSISGAGTVTLPGLDSKRLDLRISGAGRIRGSALKVGSLVARVSGSGAVELSGQMDQCEASISGAGIVELSGTAGRLEAAISGSGKVRAADLEAKSVTARISGAGDLTANATDTLDVHISGAGGVRYRGNPHISQKVSGAGQVRPLA